MLKASLFRFYVPNYKPLAKHGSFGKLYNARARRALCQLGVTANNGSRATRRPGGKW